MQLGGSAEVDAHAAVREGGESDAVRPFASRSYATPALSACVQRSRSGPHVRGADDRARGYEPQIRSTMMSPPKAWGWPKRLPPALPTA